jgi:cell wall-associated NlpC family hydrolase
MGGLALEVTGNGTGLRVSGGVGDGWYTTDTAAFWSAPGAWTADADLVTTPAIFRVLSPILGGFEPRAFAGVGVEGTFDGEATRQRAITWSVGGNLAYRLSSALVVDAEARRRTPFSTNGEPIPAGFRTGWEYRVGLALRAGSAPARRRTPTIPVRIPGMPTLPRSAATVGIGTSRSAGAVLSTADRYVGTRYTYGGTSPSGGFDCSGFVQYVFGKHGVELPRTSRQQGQVGARVSPAVRSLRAGDLILFAQNGSRIDHVAIYAGANRIIHSSSSGQGVRYDDLGTARGRWFVERMVGARRVLRDGESLVGALDALLRATNVTLDPPDFAPRPR